MIRLFSALLAVALLVFGVIFMLQRQEAEAPQPAAGATTETRQAEAGQTTGEQTAGEQADGIDISSVREMTLGAEDAPVTVIEYASFTCPHCRNFHEGPFRRLKAEYIDTGKVRFVYRDVYFDRFGLWAAMIARCEPDKFFGVADLIYKGQSEWTRGDSPEEIVNNLRRIGRLAGITEERLDACLSDGARAQTLVAWYQHNADRDGIQATPTFIINGRLVENQPWEKLKAILDAELEG